MRYLLSLGLICIALFIFAANGQAADVVELTNYKPVNKELNVSPIEPIKPIEPKANKRKFWRNKFKLKQQQNEVEPIASGWYIGMGVYVILSSVGFLIAGLSFSLIIGIFAGGSSSALIISLIFLLITLLGVIAAILYAVKLFATASGKEAILKGWRFVLGYIVGSLFTLFYVGILFTFISFIVPVSVGAIGIILPVSILVFNIIDHARYRKYRKYLENNPQ